MTITIKEQKVTTTRSDTKIMHTHCSYEVMLDDVLKIIRHSIMESEAFTCFDH